MFIASNPNLNSISYEKLRLELELESKLDSDPLLFAVLVFLSYELNQISQIFIYGQTIYFKI
jgi:hypothetical protein